MDNISQMKQDAVKNSAIPVAAETMPNPSAPLLNETETKTESVAASKMTGVHSKASAGRSLMSMARESLGLHIDNTEQRLRNELSGIQGKQQKVSDLHSLIEKLNNASNEDGTVSFDEAALAEFQASAEKLEVTLPDLKDGKLTKNEKDRLIQNINMKSDDLSTLTQRDFFKIQSLNNRITQLYELLSSMQKTVHDLMMSILRKFS